MHSAENPPKWKFGDMRGGILADEPGLGKTVTVMALITATAGALPSTPTDLWDTSAWPQLKFNPEVQQQIIRLFNKIGRAHV
mgnify:CR=1 FL=1